MKFLLVAINAKYIHSNLAVYSLKAYAQETVQKEGGLPVSIVLGEYTINHSCQGILGDIFEKKPDIVGFSCYLWNMEYVRQLVRDLPKVLNGVEIWLGGPEASYCAEELMKEFPFLSGVMRGEGEEAFARLIRYYRQGRDGEERDWLGEVGGLVYRNREGEITANPVEKPLDLSLIPFPYAQPWMETVDIRHRIIYYESSRGCPFSCSYCLSSIDKQVRFRDLELVFQELQFFLDRRVEQVKFVDRTFNCKRSHSAAIWSYLLEHDNGVTNFHFEIGADLLEEEDIALLKRMRPGLVQLEIGVQTANSRTLKEIHRTMDLERLERVVAEIREGHNVHQHLDLIAGLPFEDLESFGRSFDRVYRMRPDQLQLGFLKVLKGSWMEETKEAYGLKFMALPPYEVLETRWISYGDILFLKGIEEMVEVYYNSRQFSRTLCCLEALFSRPMELFAALADWYRRNGLETVKHSRQARYELLFSWVLEDFPEEREKFRDALTIDVYLREKAKTRPSFARDVRSCREEMQRFYQREESERRYLAAYQGFDSRQMARMTHLEVLEDGRMLLFDYRNRDPLTGNARVVEVLRDGSGN